MIIGKAKVDKRFDVSIILKRRGRATKTNISFGPFCLKYINL